MKDLMLSDLKAQLKEIISVIGLARYNAYKSDRKLSIDPKLWAEVVSLEEKIKLLEDK